ncbi:MAG: GTPase [Symploca sp. SIO3C6]|nr:GTPase [Symploca sp. SIO3C6]
MESRRIVVTGILGAGKSTFVRTASETEVLAIERKITDEISTLKEKTTVAFDFGKLLLTPNLELQIYGTPGQSRFEFMWEMLINWASAYILLVAAHKYSGFEEARELLLFMKQRAQVPMVIGLTHMDCSGALAPEEIINSLGYQYEENKPTFVTVNPHERTSVIQAINVLINIMNLQD